MYYWLFSYKVSAFIFLFQNHIAEYNEIIIDSEVYDINIHLSNENTLSAIQAED